MKKDESGKHACKHEHDFSAINKSRLKLAFLITTSMMFIEGAAGYLTNSIALTSDAVHMLVDSLALGIALGACYLEDKKNSESGAAAINGLILVVMSTFLFYGSIIRLKSGHEVIWGWMIIVAVCGLVVNLIQIYILHSADRSNINMKGAFRHVISDAACSLGVITSGLLIKFTGNTIFDPIVGLIIACFIFIYGTSLVVDAKKARHDLAS